MRRTRHSSRTPTARVRFALGLWAASVAGGLIALDVYSATPGSTAENTATWPSDAGLTRTDGRPVLVVTLHPRCPCSRATVSELNKLMTRLVDRLDVYVLFVHDAEGDDDMPAHVRNALVGCERTIPFADGRLLLGTWQGLYLWEARSTAHHRRVVVTLSGE